MRRVAVLVLMGSCLAQGANLTLEQFRRMAQTEREKMARRYTQRDRDDFWRVEGFKYQVRAQGSSEQALEIALLMDEFYDSFARTFKGGFSIATQPRLYVFADRDAYLEFMKVRDVDGAEPTGGMYLTSDRLLVTFAKATDEHLKQMLFHEATHQLLHTYTVKRSLPPWYNEGMATNFQLWEPSRSLRENVRMAIIESHYRSQVAAEAREGKLPDLQALAAMDGDDWLENFDGANYAAAWSFVNFLLSSEDGQRRLDRVLRALKKGTPVEKVMPPAVVRKLERQWHEDIRTRVMLYDEFIAPALHAASEGQVDEAIAHLEVGIAGHPSLPDGRFYRARLLLEKDRFAEALADLEAVAEQDADFPDLHLLLGRAALAAGDPAKARSHLQTHLRSHRDDQQAKELLREANRTLRTATRPAG